MQETQVLENPLRAGIRLERTADPCAVVIFGASGDLTKRKLVPALYRLAQERLLPAEFAIVGLARTEMSSDEFRERMKEAVTEFSEAKSVDEKVSEILARVDKERGTQGNRLFYLSVAPKFYAAAVKQLGEHGLAKPAGK